MFHHSGDLTSVAWSILTLARSLHYPLLSDGSLGPLTPSLGGARIFNMKLELSRFLVVVALGLTGCAAQGPSDPIDRDVACHVQADAWCPTVGFDTSGCREWYVGQCEPTGPDGSVDAGAQDECLQAIADMTMGPLGWGEPEVCQATWLDS